MGFLAVIVVAKGYFHAGCMEGDDRKKENSQNLEKFHSIKLTQIQGIIKRESFNRLLFEKDRQSALRKNAPLALPLEIPALCLL